MSESLQLAELLVSLSRAFLENRSAEALLQSVVERTPAALGVTGVGVMLRADDEGLQLSTASDERVARVAALQSSLGEGPCEEAFASGERVVELDLAAGSRWQQFGRAAAAAGMRAVVAVPVEARGERLGTLEAYSAQPSAITDEHAAAAELVAALLATSLLHAREVEQLRRLSAQLRHEALHDALTGLPNRALLLDRLGVALAKARRHPWSPAVLFCDLDGFKAVNDRYGHHEGDRLLVAVARRVRRLLRPGDTLARLSGDEFVIVLEDTAGPEEATLVAERVLEALARPFPVGGGEVSVRASIGIAMAGPATVDARDLLIRADAAMYRAKATGGARVIRAEPA